jgi:radical SAM superfamily enzyme YgiQ (UPF0313 family)
MKVSLIALNSKYIHSNPAIYYIAANCPDYDISTNEYTINDNMDNVMGEIYRENADVLGFSCYIWNIEEVLYIARNIKKVAPKKVIVLGGPEVSFDSCAILKDNPTVDYIISGEGEISFKGLLEHLKQVSKDFSSIPGIAYRNNNHIVINPIARPLKLEELPSHIDLYLSKIGSRIFYYETSRGCPYNCSYCLSSTFKGVKYFPDERIKRELKLLADNGIELVKFVDRTFNTKKTHYMEIFRFLRDIGKGRYHFEICGDILDEETMDFLEDVPKGLFQFEIGVQSTNTASLIEINRRVDFQKISNNVTRLMQWGNIHLHLDLIAGLPFEIYESFQQSFNDVISLEPDMLQMGFLKMLKGSRIREGARDHGFIFRDKAPYEVMANSYLSYMELLKLKDIEGILEKYYNSKNFMSSYRYLSINYHINNKFGFFEGFADYWRKNDYFKKSQSNADYYKVLNQFVIDSYGDSDFLSFLKYDYLMWGKNYAIPDWLTIEPDKEYRERCNSFLSSSTNIEKYLPTLAGNTTREIIKSTRIEPFSFSLESLKKGNKKDKVNTDLLFLYKNKKAIDSMEIIL